MLTILALLGVVALLFLAAALATEDRPALADAPPDAADLDLPAGPVAPEDVRRVRFALAPRGYRMSEVDHVLERLAGELADRDRRLALLEAGLEGGVRPAPDRPAAAPLVDVHEAGEADLPVAAAEPTAGEAVPPAAPQPDVSSHRVQPQAAPPAALPSPSAVPVDGLAPGVVDQNPFAAPASAPEADRQG